MRLNWNTIYFYLIVLFIGGILTSRPNNFGPFAMFDSDPLIVLFFFCCFVSVAYRIYFHVWNKNTLKILSEDELLKTFPGAKFRGARERQKPVKNESSKIGPICKTAEDEFKIFAVNSITFQSTFRVPVDFNHVWEFEVFFVFFHQYFCSLRLNN